jgi:DNA replicative helicase MCM subunit Mcm2 (Cdc46/Mcm family)
VFQYEKNFEKAERLRKDIHIMLVSDSIPTAIKELKDFGWSCEAASLLVAACWRLYVDSQILPSVIELALRLHVEMLCVRANGRQVGTE